MERLLIDILFTALVAIGYYNLFWHITEYIRKKKERINGNNY